MSSLRLFGLRLLGSSVVWFWLFNGLRLSSVLLLLPLLSRLLTEADLGFYFILASMISFIPLLDIGFLPAISRSVSYAMAGARTLKAHGMESPENNLTAPNFPLLWQLLSTTRALYQRLAIGVLSRRKTARSRSRESSPRRPRARR